MENIGLSITPQYSPHFLKVNTSGGSAHLHVSKSQLGNTSTAAQRTTRVLYLEENKDHGDLLKITLNQSGCYECKVVTSVQELKQELLNKYDILISEYHLEGVAIDHVIRSVKEHKPRVPIIILADEISEEQLDQVIRCGASDIIYKENIRRIPAVIDRVIEENETRLELERYKEEAESQNALLDAMFDGFEDIIVLKDANLNYLKVNRSALRFLHIAENNLIGKKRSDLFDDKATKEDEEEDKRVLTESGPLRFQQETIDEDGTRRFWDTIKTPIRTDGTITGIASISRDITNETLSQVENRKNEAILAQAEELVNCGSFQYDLDRDIVQGSPNFMRLMGMKSGQNKISLSRFIRHVHEEDRPTFVRDMEIALDNRRPLQVRNRIQTPDSKGHKWYITRMIPDQQSGDMTKFIGTVVEESSVQGK